MNELPTIFSIYIIGVTLAIVGSVAATLVLNGKHGFTIVGFVRRFVMSIFSSTCLFFVAFDFTDNHSYMIFAMGITGFFSEDVIEVLKKNLFKRIGEKVEEKPKMESDDAKKG